jgi:uncharacterized protein with HEPN domain
MLLEARKLLYDVQQAAQLVQRFTQGLSLAAYSADPMIRSAVERQFEIIGEALGKLAKLDSELAARVGDFRRIISFRNLLIHGYDAVADEVVWGVVEMDVLPLLENLEGLLGQGAGPPSGRDA